MDTNHFNVVLKLKPGLTASPFFTINRNSVQVHNIAEFNFDKIIENEPDNSSAFEFLKPSLNSCFKGINLSILAYGEKGSGKTFSIFGNQLTSGVVPLTIAYLFYSLLQQKFTYSCSMVAIGNNKLVDLLQENPEIPRLRIKKDVKGAVFVENLAEIIVEKEEDCFFLIKRGLKHRKELKFQADVVFQLIIESNTANKKGQISAAKITFCEVFHDKSSHNWESLSSVLTCLSNNVSAPYRDSFLTKILSDTLNNLSNCCIFTTVSNTDSLNKTFEVLSLTSSCRKIKIYHRKNENPPTGFHALKKLHNDISRLKNVLKVGTGGKNLSDEVNLMKKETEKLKSILNEQSTVEEVEALIKQNKFLKSQLEHLIGRPAAEGDVELPDSVQMLQNALVLTEDLIKKRKLILADQEMKEKLRSQGRCTICTLKVPCKHTKNQNISAFSTPLKQKTSSQDFYLNSHRHTRPQTPALSEKFIQKTERKIRVLSQIETYHEQKILKELERVENEKKTQEEEMLKRLQEEQKHQKYLEKNREKLKVYKKNIEKRAESERKFRKKHRSRSKDKAGVIIIPNYEERRKSISNILKAQSRFFRITHVRANSMSYIESDYGSKPKPSQ